MAVPKFGGWESRDGAAVPTDYSVIFATARENRKQTKLEIYEPQLDDTRNGDQLISHQGNPRARRARFLRYFNCCIKA